MDANDELSNGMIWHKLCVSLFYPYIDCVPLIICIYIASVGPIYILHFQIKFKTNVKNLQQMTLKSSRQKYGKISLIESMMIELKTMWQMKILIIISIYSFNPFPHTTILQQTTLNIFCQNIESGKHCGKTSIFFKKPSAAEASESVYMRERVKHNVFKSHRIQMC